MDPAWIALIGTLFGGAGLKIAEHYLGRGRVRVDEASRLREELRLEISEQREEIRQLELALEQRTKEYYDLRDKYAALNTELTMALDRLRQRAKEIGPPPT